MVYPEPRANHGPTVIRVTTSRLPSVTISSMLPLSTLQSVGPLFPGTSIELGPKRKTLFCRLVIGRRARLHISILPRPKVGRPLGLKRRLRAKNRCRPLSNIRRYGVATGKRSSTRLILSL